MSLRIDLDLRHGLTAPAVEQAADGSMDVRLSLGAETLAVRLSIASLETLSLAIVAALLRLKRC